MKYSITEDKYLSKEELNHLNRLIQDDNTRDAIIIKLALATGARASEILNIKVADLNDKERSVYIRGLKGSDNRRIPLDRCLYSALKALALHSDNERVFGINYRRLAEIWAKYAPNGKPFKSLRHTFAIETYRRTENIMLIKAALGHKSLINTNIYAEHLYQNELLKELLIRKRG